MTGASWDLTQRIKIEASYRYMTLGSAQSGAIACAAPTGPCAGQIQQIGLRSHDLRIGLRYGLADGAL
jgi:opacity protein-like surface antigen